VIHSHQALLDDRALVEIGRHVVRGRADELDTLGVRLMVRLGTLGGSSVEVNTFLCGNDAKVLCEYFDKGVKSTRAACSD
jgi:hypothetical protein